MKKIILIVFLFGFYSNILADNPEFEKRVKETIELIKNGEIEKGLITLIGEGTLLYDNFFNITTNKNNQIAQIQNFENVYGKLIGHELVWSRKAGEVTNQWYMIYYENYPMVLDIIFYEVEGKISVLKYSFEETATEIPAAL